jgi:hypothetical protein
MPVRIITLIISVLSGHTFLRCARNLENAVDTFKPGRYVIIETSTVTFDTQSIVQVLNGDYPVITSHNEGLIGYLQKFPYLRLAYKQINTIMGVADEESAADAEAQAGNNDDRGAYRNRLINYFIR